MREISPVPSYKRVTISSMNMKKSPYNKEAETTYNFSGLKKSVGGVSCAHVVEEQTTTSATSEVLFVKIRDSRVRRVTWLKRTRDEWEREFLKHCDKGDHSIYSPNTRNPPFFV